MSENTEKKSVQKTTVARAALTAVIESLLAEGVEITVDDSPSAWTKISGKSGAKVYVQKREDVREVHLSGWGRGRAGTIDPPKKNGKVEAHLDLSADDVPAAFEGVLRELASLQPKAAPLKAPREPKEKPAAKPAQEQRGGEEGRLDRLRARAIELGLGEKVELSSDGAARDPEAFAEAVDAVARDMQSGSTETVVEPAAEARDGTLTVDLLESMLQADEAEAAGASGMPTIS